MRDNLSIDDDLYNYDLNELDTDEHEPVARMNFSSTFKNTRRHGHIPIPESKIDKRPNPNIEYLDHFPMKVR